jgi:ribosomal protein S18 acetylase RimI-like enzyme
MDLTVMARQDGQLVGGCHGGTWGGTCELQSLWVEPAHRHGGLGRGLLALAEREAQERGCHQVVLFTHQFQAPGFYEGLGYRVVGRVDDYPSGTAALWFRKPLNI